MLSEKVLPFGMGHRTNCILQIEGSDSENGYVLTEREPDTPKSIEQLEISIKKLADALKNNESNFVRILFPKTKCRLLREGVVLVEGPGIGVTTELNLWLDKFCLDADVFVLVSDAVATLTQTEKNFFQKVSERLSSTNIFVLLNRWDQSVFEDDVAEVREQHIDRHLEFLYQELNGMDRDKGLERIFFVSAKEALSTRLVEKGEERAKAQLPGQEERHIRFCNFERALEECMSQTAVKTKFERNNNLGKSITTENCALVKDILKSIRQHIDRMRFDRNEMAKHLDFMERQLTMFKCEFKYKITKTVAGVCTEIAKMLTDEINRLPILVGAFNKPFPDDQNSLNEYTQVLSTHVEIGLSRKVELRCTEAQKSAQKNTMQEMTDKMVAKIVPEEYQTKIQKVMHWHDNNFAFRNGFGSRDLFAEFNGFGSQNLFSDFLKMLGFDFNIPLEEIKKWIYVVTVTLALAILSRFLPKKFVVLGVLGVVGLPFYNYYNNLWFKEQDFKTRYVEYVSTQLRSIVSSYSTICSEQVERVLSSTFDELCKEAGSIVDTLKKEVEQQDITIKQLDSIVLKAEAY
ncbi:mitofusin-2-like [Dreissena polymorpha]|nr:mitofusin-2-like [Dreissena polymorpha]